MFYIIYGLLYLISLLPLRILFLFSDFAGFIVFRLIKYRRDVVMHNLQIAFPEKTKEERQAIANKFFRNFCDTFIESVKMISLSRKEFERRCSIDISDCNELLKKGKNVHFHSGHQMNWEYANWIYAKNLITPWVGVYSTIGSPALNKVFLKMRSRYNTVLVSTKDFKDRRHEVFQRQYSLALAADQNPGNPANAYWLNFFSKKAPFLSGPGKGAVKNNAAVVFVTFIKLRRGYYHFENKIITENASTYTPEQLTIMYRDFLEEIIRKHPDNYLWSHRRWKHDWKPEYGPITLD